MAAPLRLAVRFGMGSGTSADGFKIAAGGSQRIEHGLPARIFRVMDL